MGKSSCAVGLGEVGLVNEPLSVGLERKESRPNERLEEGAE